MCVKLITFCELSCRFMIILGLWESQTRTILVSVRQPFTGEVTVRVLAIFTIRAYSILSRKNYLILICSRKGLSLNFITNFESVLLFPDLTHKSNLNAFIADDDFNFDDILQKKSVYEKKFQPAIY